MCMDGGVYLYKFVMVTFHATECMLGPFVEEGILQEKQFGGEVGWMRQEIASAVMAISDFSCL